MPTLQQLAASLDPKDQAALAAMTGSSVGTRSANNQYSVGGTSYKPWLTALASQHLTEPTPGAMAQQWAAEGLGTIDSNGKWQWAADKGWDAGDAPSTGWSGTTEAGDFAGGTGIAAADGDGRNILASYWKTKPDGTPDYAAMGTEAFFNTLPEDVRRAYVANKLGAKYQGIAGTNVSGNPVGGSSGAPATGGATGQTPTGSTVPAAAAPGEYVPPKAAAYTAPERGAYDKTPFDFFNDAGYKFQLQEGTKGIENSAAARGGLQSGNTLKSLAKFQTGLAAQEYGAANDRYNQDRNFREGQFTGDRSFGRAGYESDRNFNQNTAVDARNFNNNNRIDARNFDYSGAVNDRNFNYAKDVDNRNFDYNAATGDRTYNTNTLQNLAQLGLGASGTSGGLAATLAAILGNNTMTGAGAGANATVGTGNNTNNFISQLLNQLYGNSIVNSVKP